MSSKRMIEMILIYKCDKVFNEDDVDEKI